MSVVRTNAKASLTYEDNVCEWFLVTLSFRNVTCSNVLYGESSMTLGPAFKVS